MKLDSYRIDALIITAEECAEVQQMISKTLRFGLDGYHPLDLNRTRNASLLEAELGDVLAMIHVLTAAGIVTEAGLQAGKLRQLQSLPDFSNMPKEWLTTLPKQTA